MVLESVMATEALVMFRAAVKVTLGVTAVLNSNPAGVLRIKVMFVPTAKSPVAPSAMVIVPSVVHAPDPPVPAESAEMAVPPDAGVTVTDANAALAMARKSPAIRVSRVKDVNFFIDLLSFFECNWRILEIDGCGRVWQSPMLCAQRS
jgi:hypothetical protein